MPRTGEKCCANCVHSFLKDTGYSDMTIDGVEVRCLINKNPESEWEEFEDADQFAEKCPHFKEGNLIHLNVEDEDPFDEKVANG